MIFAEDGQDRTLGNINILKRSQTRITLSKGTQGYSKEAIKKQEKHTISKKLKED